MVDVIYKITYKPHLETEYPKYYVGSKKNYNPKRFYLGSVSSSQIWEYTDGLTLCEWWKIKTRGNSEDFVFEILEETELTPQELIELEKSWQIELGVLTPEYFNQSLATSGFCSKEKSPTTRKIQSQKTKEYWDSPAGLEKKKRLSERNRRVKSAEMKEKWQNPTEAMKNIGKKILGIKRSDETRAKMRGPKKRVPCLYCDRSIPPHVMQKHVRKCRGE